MTSLVLIVYGRLIFYAMMEVDTEVPVCRRLMGLVTRCRADPSFPPLVMTRVDSYPNELSKNGIERIHGHNSDFMIRMSPDMVL